MNAPSDQELVKKCLGGNEACFGTLLERYEQPVFNLALRYSGNEDDAADITQSAFVKVYENLATYDPGRKFFSWMYRIALNEALNFARSKKNNADFPEDIAADDTGIHEVLERKEEQERVDRALFSIHEDLRTVIVLHYFTGCSYADMSYILGIPESTVKSRLYEARHRLRRLLYQPRHA